MLPLQSSGLPGSLPVVVPSDVPEPPVPLPESATGPDDAVPSPEAEVPTVVPGVVLWPSVVPGLRPVPLLASVSFPPGPSLGQPVTAKASALTTMNRSAFVIGALDRAAAGHSNPRSDSSSILRLALPLVLAGCTEKVLDASSFADAGKGPGETCTLDREDGCAEGLACEPLVDAASGRVCAAPVEIHGGVIDALDGAPIPGALVAAADEPGTPVTTVVETDADGRYVLPVSVRRDAGGEPAEAPRWTLLVSARGYFSFPGALRPALPIDAQAAVPSVDATGPWIIEDASTVVALVSLSPAAEGGVTLSGRVEGERASGTLVVAEGPPLAPMAVADADGEFVLFNVPMGSITVRGYREGVELEPAAVTVGGQDIEGLRLPVITDDPAEMAVVEGSVVLVDSGGGQATSVVLVPSSVYQPAFERGPVPQGLRAPAPPDAPSITSSFAIAGVPAGRYHVLAAFENDGLVRDPDASIAGTQIAEIEVTAGAAIELDASFKITAALQVVGPGADAPEEVDGAPTFAWIDDASEDRYELVVYDARGTEVWRNDQLPRVTGGGTVEVPYGGPALVSGMIHQFRVISWSDGPQGSTALTRTEDLRGVFVVR